MIGHDRSPYGMTGKPVSRRHEGTSRLSNVDFRFFRDAPRRNVLATAARQRMRAAVMLVATMLAASSAVAAPDQPSDAKAARKPPLDLTATRTAAVDVADRGPAIQKANAWFNAAQTMIGDFVQIGPDGRKSEGKIYVQRPGKLRFEYAQPATMEIVADGTSVIIRDRKLATQDTYFLAQTPLKFLLKDNIDLNKDVRVQSVTSDGAATNISVEDKATFGGTSHIRLTFDNKSSTLTQWLVTDPQGYDTKVSLYNLDLSRKPDPALFRINQERFLNPN